jgi:hypothetical protein
MAKLTDLPAELINRIVHHVLFSAPQPATGEDEDRPKRKDLLDHDHHLLDHTQLDCALKPKPRPHRERLPNPQGHKYDPALTYAEPVSWPEGKTQQQHSRSAIIWLNQNIDRLLCPFMYICRPPG